MKPRESKLMCLSILAYCKLLQERYCNGRFIAIIKLLCIQDARSDCLQTVLLQRMSAVKMDLSVSVVTFRLLDILFARHTLILRQIIVFLKHTFHCIFSCIGFFFQLGSRHSYHQSSLLLPSCTSRHLVLFLSVPVSFSHQIVTSEL